MTSAHEVFGWVVVQLVFLTTAVIWLEGSIESGFVPQWLLILQMVGKCFMSRAQSHAHNLRLLPAGLGSSYSKRSFWPQGAPSPDFP